MDLSVVAWQTELDSNIDVRRLKAKLKRVVNERDIQKTYLWPAKGDDDTSPYAAASHARCMRQRRAEKPRKRRPAGTGATMSCRQIDDTGFDRAMDLIECNRVAHIDVAAMINANRSSRSHHLAWLHPLMWWVSTNGSRATCRAERRTRRAPALIPRTKTFDNFFYLENGMGTDGCTKRRRGLQ
ncbi:hypothetical protein [Burkholderia territorii]|uniref:Uncharacterized protein n=1 Tax=Burkholderia territorii TaxID=1503055 RepID=A0A6L3NJU7_9BURK|nr:hypothetical protein [Burkholderia territorii]KAB0677158.1 hypothetical protein F7R13_13045 [Burkholderia territorii]MBM2775975.1 hypothetical protein [Burkholderia territorii]